MTFLICALVTYTVGVAVHRAHSDTDQESRRFLEIAGVYLLCIGLIGSLLVMVSCCYIPSRQLLVILGASVSLVASGLGLAGFYFHKPDPFKFKRKYASEKRASSQTKDSAFQTTVAVQDSSITWRSDSTSWHSRHA